MNIQLKIDHKKHNIYSNYMLKTRILPTCILNKNEKNTGFIIYNMLIATF